MAPRSAKKEEAVSVKINLGPCRMSFPHLFKPQETDGGPKYQSNFLFPPGYKWGPFEDAMDEAMESLFGPRKNWPKGRTDRLPDEVIRDATEKDYAGYKKGWTFIKASSKDPVGIVDAVRDEVTNPRDVYGGRWCRISVTVKAYDNKSKGIGVYLNSVQVLDHDEQFGGRGPAKNDFEDWEGDPLSDDDRETSASRGRDDDDDDRGARGRDRGSSRNSRDTRDEEPRTRRSRDDEDEPRGGRSRRGDDEDDRPSRGRDRDRDDDRKRSRDDDEDRPARGRMREDDDDGRAPARRGRDDTEERPSRVRGRGAEEDVDPPRRSRDDDTERGSSRTSSRGASRSRDEDEDEPRGRSRGREDEPARGRGRARDDDDERPSRGRSRRDDDDDWN